MKCADYLKNCNKENFSKENNCKSNFNNTDALSLVYKLYIQSMNNFANVIREKVFGKTEKQSKQSEQSRQSKRQLKSEAVQRKLNNSNNKLQLSNKKLKVKTEINSKPNPELNPTPNKTKTSNPNPKTTNPKPFISILYKNGILYKTYLTNEEQLILKMAVLYNRGIVNLLRRKESIKNLFNKGLLTIYDNKNNANDINNGLVCVSDVVRMIVCSGQNLGCLSLSENISGNKNENKNGNAAVNKSQLEVLGVSWCMNNDRN